MTQVEKAEKILNEMGIDTLGEPMEVCHLSNGAPAQDADADKPLPLFEVRVAGMGSMFIEAVSQVALVDYITNVMYSEEVPNLAPFRVELRKDTDKFETFRTTVYIDPGRIILVGPSHSSSGPADSDPNFDALVEKITKVAPSAEVILLTDEGEDKDSDGDEDGPK